MEAVIDSDEPPLPGHITTTHAAHFAEALIKGGRGGWNLIKTVVKDKVREII